MGRSGIRRRRRSGAGAAARSRTDAPPRRTPRILRSPWLATWLQPFALAAIVLVGRPLAGPQPSDADERWVLVVAAAVTLPGLVAAVVGGVAAARRERAGRRARYQRLLDWSAPRAASSTPDLPPSVAAEIGVSVIGWAFLLAALDLGLMLVLLALPLDEWWRTLPALPVVLALVVALLTLLLGILSLALGVLRIAGRGDTRAALTQVPSATPRPDGRMDPAFRLMLSALGVCLLGLAVFGVPGAVLEIAYDVDSPWLAAVFVAAPEGPATVAAWWTAQRVTAAMALGGLAAVAVLSPLAYWRMVARPRRRARDS